MKKSTPHTRTAATAGRETSHLSRAQQSALEAGGEAEHHTGARKERLIRRATKLAEKPPKSRG